MTRASWLTVGAGMASTLALLASGCSGAGDGAGGAPGLLDPGPRQAAFLNFPSAGGAGGPAVLEVADFPRRLSETGAFADAALLASVSGIVPYAIVAPLWSNGAAKQRWISVPAGTRLGHGEAGRLVFPPGTVLVKHFEMAMDERFPERRRRLETRFWVVVSDEEQYGVTYRWNADQTDAELLRAPATEELSITSSDGRARSQRYFYPGPQDCYACHNSRVGFVLGVRLAQLDREASYDGRRGDDAQLAAWSSWGLLEPTLDGGSGALAPRLVDVNDELASIQDRVRSYWDGNCSMCHAGADGPVPGWDARFSTPLEEQGLFEAPRSAVGGAARLITPGSPGDSLIYLRGNTSDFALRMPPIGRNRIDSAYVELLARWIISLEPAAR